MKLGYFLRKTFILKKVFTKSSNSSETRDDGCLQGHADGTISLRALATTPLAQGIEAACVGEAGAAHVWLEPHSAAITCMMQHRWQSDYAAAQHCVLVTGEHLASRKPFLCTNSRNIGSTQAGNPMMLSHLLKHADDLYETWTQYFPICPIELKWGSTACLTVI